MRMVVAALSLAFSVMASSAYAYSQNSQLERNLSINDPNALALFPAKGFKDGAAGFFATHALYVVPGSPRAWCTGASHGILKPGCYVELYIQGEGIKPRDSRGDPCGQIVRWHRAPGSQRYLPTPGSRIAKAIARGEWEKVESAIYEEPGTKIASPGSCDWAIDAKSRMH